MCNDTLPKTYFDKSLSSIDSILMEFVGTVEMKHHQCALDHLYNSAKFFKAAYNHEKNY